MSKYISKLLYILQGRRKALLFLAFLFLLISLMEMVGIGLIGPFIAIATDPNVLVESPLFKSLNGWLGFTSANQFLLAFGLALIVIFCLKAILSFSIQKYIFSYGFGIQGELQSRLMRAYLSAPYTFHLGRNTATLTQSIVNDVVTFCNSALMPILTSVSNLAVLIGLTGLLVFTSPLATVVIAGILLVGYVLFYLLKDRMTRWGTEAGEANTEIIRLINHSMGGLKETRIIGCEPYFNQQMQYQTRRYARMASASVSSSTLPRYVLEVFLMAFLILITFIFLTFNQRSPGQLSAVLGVFALASMRMMPAASNLIGAINGIRYANYAVDKLYFDLRELEAISSTAPSSLQLAPPAGKHSVPEKFASEKPMSFKKDIILEQVNYRYPTGSGNALNQVSLRIQRGQSIGLIGRSGAGKTTMVDIILGLLKPQSGDIKVDGVSIYKDIRAWQNLVGYVPQSIFLMDDTLEKNIAFGVSDPLIDHQRLYAALESAQLLELVQQLPDGLQTLMGERGVRLSGGQRQRVGIARALYHQREILVLDEATAALDNETEKLISESIKSLSGTKTIIIIAHRLSTIEHCDCVHMMEKGRVVKSGTYREVVSAT